MSARKTEMDLSGLVATKGHAVPVANVPARSAAPASSKGEGDRVEAGQVPLNFRVTADLRRRFRMYAAAHDLKLNELLRLAFEDYARKN